MAQPTQVTSPPPKKGLLTKRNIVIIVVVFIALSILGGGSSLLSTPKTIIVEVQYNGQWLGILINNNLSVSWSGTGSYSRTLSPPSSGPWIISVSAQKAGSDFNTLILRIKTSDGKILAERSTAAAYGIVQLTYTIS